MQMSGTHDYYGSVRRAAHGGRNSHIHDLSSNYYGASIIQNQPQRKPIVNGSNNNNFGHHSISDNDQ
ncbi:unnamed protein product, partial [Adineta steineri]